MIKELILAGLMAAVLPVSTFSYAATTPAAETPTEEEVSSEPEMTAEEFVANLHPQTGKVVIGDNLATVNLPKEFVYLNNEEAERVLQAWGNPPSDELPLGMILPAGISPLEGEAWAVTIEYEESGYVSDEDAADIDYDEMLKDMQSESKEANKYRAEQGYEPVELVGWAAKPHYDSEGKKLYWAKELKFGDSESNTLNYNIRVLGRKGVLILNFVAGMEQLPEIEKNLPAVLASTDFNDGSRYANFNPDLDKVAAYGLGALIAGKVAAKVGFFAVALVLLKKFWFVLIGGGVWLFRRMGGKAKAQPVAAAPVAEPEPVPVVVAQTPAATVMDLNKGDEPKA